MKKLALTPKFMYKYKGNHGMSQMQRKGILSPEKSVLFELNNVKITTSYLLLLFRKTTDPLLGRYTSKMT